ncbi:MAG: HEAT repeat domain-containing protein [Vampirovibrionales bacterium]|nr:HEAT repeat domain-containing protein [Vampirovibrionales bacterium]
MNQDIISIRKIKSKGAGDIAENFAIPAMGIQTPQGRRLIPNPSGFESWVFDTLEEAQNAIHQAGFAAEFEGQVFPSASATQQINNPRASRAITLSTGSLEQSIPLLVKCLSDKEPAVVANAALALGNMQAAEALPALFQHLAHEDGTVRKQIAEAISKFAQAAVPYLQRAWDATQNGPSDSKTPYIRLTLATACTHWAQRNRQLPAPLLLISLNALEDSNWLVKSQAALTLAVAADMAALEDL